MFFSLLSYPLNISLSVVRLTSVSLLSLLCLSAQAVVCCVTGEHNLIWEEAESSKLTTLRCSKCKFTRVLQEYWASAVDRLRCAILLLSVEVQFKEFILSDVFKIESSSNSPHFWSFKESKMYLSNQMVWIVFKLTYRYWKIYIYILG